MANVVKFKWFGCKINDKCLAGRFPSTYIDLYIVMPNHVRRVNLIAKNKLEYIEDVLYKYIMKGVCYGWLT